jgi:hypothetical protein
MDTPRTSEEIAYSTLRQAILQGESGDVQSTRTLARPDRAKLAIVEHHDDDA